MDQTVCSHARLITIVALAFALAGCLPPARGIQPYQPQPGVRIGVIDALDAEAKHVHMGTANLGDFERTVRGTAWPHAQAFESAVRASVAPRLGAAVVRIPTPDWLRESRRAVMYRFDDHYYVRDELVPQLQALGARHGVDVLVMLLPDEAKPDPKRAQMTQGHGLFTRCLGAACSGYALDLFTVEVLVLKPQYRQVTDGSLTAAKVGGALVQPVARPEQLAEGLPIEGDPAAIGAAEVNAEWPGIEATIKRRTRQTLQVAGLAD